MFKNISELPPAHVLLASQDRVELRPYWRLAYDEPTDIADERRIVEEIGDLIEDATRIRLRADVPVGAYLSGGLDSSLVTALASRAAPSRLKTFSVRFEDPEFDEGEFQDEMIAALGVEHRSILGDETAIAASFPAVIRHAERPVLRTAPAPLYLLSALVRESGVKVVLTGEGADEVFAGYDIFKEAKLRRFCARQPQSRLRPLLFRRLYPYLPKVQAQSAAYLKAFFATDEAAAGDPLFSHLPRFRTTAGAKLFFDADLRRALAGYDALDDLRSRLPDEFAAWSPLSQAQYLETAFLLPGYILSSQGDRMAMANGVEGRFPFLDHRVVEAASHLPPRLRLCGLREKHVLREAAKDLLPRRLAARPKQPYRAPEGACFGAGAPAYVGELLLGRGAALDGVFDRRAVAKLHEKCRAGRLGGFRDNAALTGILSTALWQAEFIAAGAKRTSEMREQAVA
jgi:asparagine synthase (glutamine-hydrolysing)